MDPPRAPGRELSEFLSAYYVCVCAPLQNSPSFLQNSPSLPQNSVSSLFRKSLSKQYSVRFPERERIGRPLKTTFDMTTLIFSSGGCPSYPFYPLKRVPSYPFLAENPSSEGATKDHLSSKPPQGEPPGTKNLSGR